MFASLSDAFDYVNKEEKQICLLVHLSSIILVRGLCRISTAIFVSTA